MAPRPAPASAVTDPAKMDAALRLLYGDMSGPGSNQSEGTARHGVANGQNLQANGAGGPSHF